DAESASNIEGAEVDRRAFAAVLHEQTRDEKSAQDEEHGDAHRAPDVDHAGPEGQVPSHLQDLSRVTDDHHQGCEGAQPIETRQSIRTKQLQTTCGEHVWIPPPWQTCGRVDGSPTGREAESDRR